MRVLRFIGKAIIVLFAVFGVLVVAGLVGLGLAWRDLPRLTAEAPPARAVLTFDLADGLVESQSANPLALATLSSKVTVRDLLRALEAAKSDGRIMGLLLRLGSGSLDLAHAQELAAAVADFRESGKFVIAFAESFNEGGSGNSRYLLASAADQVWLQPSGELQMTGLALQVPFARDLLDKLGVTARMDHRKQYKGAINSFTETAMPAPQRENMQALIDSWAGQLADAVARNRHIESARARQLIVGGPYDAAAAKAAGLIDGTHYWEEVLAAALLRAGGDAKKYAVADYLASLPDPPRDASRIAVVYGIGPVVLGRSDDNAIYGRQAMASTTVADALHAAVDDPKIAGIILRIDSPGGSYLASDTIWHEVARARQRGKPLVVSMAGVAASGGYFVAAPAATIIAEPGTITGSIGVFGGKVVIKDLLAKLGLAVDGVASGPNALADSATADYTPEQWAKLESELDRIYGDFVDKVAAGRHLGRDAVEAAAKGQIWSGAAAKQRGLVDELGGFDTAVAALRRLAGIAPNAVVALAEYPAPRSTLEAALARLLSTDGAGAAALARLLQVAQPILAAIDSVSASLDEQRLRAPLP
jgi:protease IV